MGWKLDVRYRKPCHTKNPMPKELKHIGEDPQVENLLGILQEKIDDWWKDMDIYPLKETKKVLIITRVAELLIAGNF